MNRAGGKSFQSAQRASASEVAKARLADDGWARFEELVMLPYVHEKPLVIPLAALEESTPQIPAVHVPSQQEHPNVARVPKIWSG